MRTNECLRAGWRFAPAGALLETHAEKGDACPLEARLDFDDSSWRAISVPHDFVIEETPQPQEDRLRGYLRHGQGWYRLRFSLPREDEGRRLTLLFEGVASRCAVWLNGFRLCVHEGQFCSFEVDISQAAEYGGENLLCLWADASYQEGWWYGGGGIYRPVWLRKTEAVCVDLWGLCIRTEHLGGERWRTAVQADLVNDRFEAVTGRMTAWVETAEGQAVAQSETVSFSLSARAKGGCAAALTVEGPRRWDIDSPALYRLRVRLWDAAGNALDEATERFGFRTFRFDADAGFFLNERSVKLKGVCCHQDYGLTGVAIPPRIERLRLEKLKAMGANAYRSAHNPSSSHQMDVCDELGLLVMAENRAFSFSAAAQEQLRMLIRRDQNRPSVILWSVGNEEPAQARPQGRRIAQALQALAHQLDPTRPVTLAQDGGLDDGQAISVMDVIGINYNTETYDRVHAAYPCAPMLASECGALGTTRGYYGPDDPARGYFSAYDHPVGVYVADRAETWRRIAQRPFMAGMFLWSGVEHRGETQWPRLCSQSGCLDFFLQEKDAYYQTQAQWTQAPMLHLLPHWNFPGREGERIRVVAYTNQPEAELFLNGVSQGRLTVPPFGYAQWEVPYAPGRLEAKAFRGEGVTAQALCETTGAPVRLRLVREENAPVYARAGETLPLKCLVLDAQGRPVPTADPKVYFSLQGAGRILATGSDVCDHNPPREAARAMRAGVIAVLAGAFERPGPITLRAESDGLEPGTLTVEIQ